MAPDFIYFDLGNVLLSFDHERMVRQMAAAAGVSDDRMRRALFPTGDTTDALWRFEAGEVSETEFYERLCDQTGVRPERSVLDLAMSDIFEPIDESLRLAQVLATSGRRLGLLSNTNAIHWRYVLDGRYPTLNSAFEQPLASFQVGVMKPAPAIYEYAVAQAGVPADRVLFIDDKPENVEGALRCGLDAVLFTAPHQLAHDLADRGLPIA